MNRSGQKALADSELSTEQDRRRRVLSGVIFQEVCYLFSNGNCCVTFAQKALPNRAEDLVSHLRA